MPPYYSDEDAALQLIDQRMHWFQEYDNIRNVTEVCLIYGISRKTFYKWFKRYERSGYDPKGLKNLPRTPHHSPLRTSEIIRAQIIEMRETTGHGPRRISRELESKTGIHLSERTIWKILKQTADQRQEQMREATYTPVFFSEQATQAA
jgi:transposase